ncbi:SMI1/KNR4 family protein [Calothrix sp. NIES-2098]|uniref:SMI1/KNR4 family protein n=1 Tax=Calothrix sp. NIES-2098 TaxID=1954171 RepID=UPI000B5F0891|nr:hypothetical protein NIES2098_65710 [Calothrix sp. NIES-2098]
MMPMSMNDVIDRIAIEAEQNPSDNVVEYYCDPYAYNLLKPEEIKNGLSPERISELNQEIILRQHLPSPRLTVDEIDAILSDYPYKLPVEFYDLYQRGNGVLPIGLGDKDWDCYYNYFYFPDPEICLFSLGGAMSFYNLLNSFDRYRAKVEPNIFPLIQAEVGIWAIAGSETQQPTSPVFRFHEEDLSVKNFKIRIVWNSLTEMISDRCSERV